MKRHGILFILQVTAIGLLFIAMWRLAEARLYFSVALALVLIVGLVANLYRRQLRPVEKMERLISAIRFSDFNLSFRSPSAKDDYKKLAEDLDEALSIFRSRLYGVEVQQQYYDTLLSTIDSGILVMDKEGQIEWMNKAAAEEFGKGAFTHVDELEEVHSGLPALLHNLRPGEIKILHIERKDISHELAVSAILFTVKGKELLLVSLKNIHSVLEENEIEAWQKLIRVLTHEIMNSIAPIISLSETVTERAALNGMNEKDYAVMLQSMQTIHRRSKGLLGFVENYRKLTRIPAPVLSPVPVKELFSDIKELFSGETAIGFAFRIVPTDLCLMADRTLIEQVLINLIKNACEACRTQPSPEIIVEAALSPASLPLITVSDNGLGILPDVIDKIFVPFFTTKPGGSGIGLSVCRQIMNRHGGNISVTSEVEKGATFTLHFGTRASSTQRGKKIQNNSTRR